MSDEQRRLRAPRARDGQLKAKWGSIEGDSPDLCYVWGSGIPRADARLLHDTLASPRFRPLSREWDMSFMEEMKDRGYDISTLEISISRKVGHEQEGAPAAAQEALDLAMKTIAQRDEEILRLTEDLRLEKECNQMAMSHIELTDAEIKRLRGALEGTKPSRDVVVAELEGKLDMEAVARREAEAEVERLQAELAELRGDLPTP
jgi:hypothetical protein